GLATAACLGRIGVRVTLALGERSSGESSMICEGQAGARKPNPGTGIWTHGLECLHKLGVLDRLESQGRYMGEAGYREPSGKWLARPSQPLGIFDPSSQGRRKDELLSSGSGGSGVRGDKNDIRRPSILFVRESNLLEVRTCPPAMLMPYGIVF
ncbi:unnamed protein product, partial [Sphacelaria rigidula]